LVSNGIIPDRMMEHLITKNLTKGNTLGPDDESVLGLPLVIMDKVRK